SDALADERVLVDELPCAERGPRPNGRDGGGAEARAGLVVVRVARGQTAGVPERVGQIIVLEGRHLLEKIGDGVTAEDDGIPSGQLRCSFGCRDGAEDPPYPDVLPHRTAPQRVSGRETGFIALPLR